ncbi:MAG: DUF3786 domain-containing protein [Eubacterium sp.]|nr:DUF3786 domain-containing protein [Eubacterium sp.]
MENKKPPYGANNLTELPLAHYRELFREADVQEIAARCGLTPEENTFTLTVCGDEKKITWPDFENEGFRDKDRILFLRYLLEGRAAGTSNVFAAYRNLPNGDLYNAKFTQRCINRLAGTFGTKPEAFRKGCEALGGKTVKSSGTAYEIEFMPGLSLQFILWEGDDEFPASAQILFSDNFPKAFSGEDRVVVCEYILGLMTMRAYA